MLKKKTQNSEKSANTGNAADAPNQQIAELTNDLQRTRADFENYRKQMDVQRSQAVEYAKQDTVKQFLPLLDDLDRAITATPELTPLMKNLEKTVKELGLTKINSEPGTDFNPDLHDAVMMEDGEGEKEVIAETLRAGYLYNDAVLRPAMVKVKNA
ncbi:nucleotide exchange factor GrpE [Candidatus Saccharibacteria bacterium]|nr:nucleotide exchange factor GrpE [Candidatus Saccharibacteria bacterium]